MAPQLKNTTLLARVADLEVTIRRLSGKRNPELGSGSRPITWVLRLYRTASRYRPGSVEEAENLCLLLERMTVLDLFEMARQTRDPFPWLTLVNCLDAIATLGVETEDAEDAVMEIAHAMLGVQGLERIPLERLLATPSGTYRALSAISS
jgi:hypothetical protein